MTVVVSFLGGGPWSIAVHGGAGAADDPAERAARVAGCERAAAAGEAILAAGGSALAAVEAAVLVLEDDPLFNAGTGGYLDAEGGLTFDASIMDGATFRGGGVCALPAFAHPIAIARAVLERTQHVLLAGEGAARFAEGEGFVRADPELMITERARRKLEAARGRASDRAGTVGAVARDVRGHVAAATSTGGTSNKLPGRVGDSPVIGAGSYADDRAGACSTTGDGEAILRVGLARLVVDGDVEPARSLAAALGSMLERTQGTGGAILVRRDGALGVARTTAAMAWAIAHAAGRASGC